MHKLHVIRNINVMVVDAPNDAGHVATIILGHMADHYYSMMYDIKGETLCGGVRPPSPPRHDTTAPEEPVCARIYSLIFISLL